ncbi:MAG: integration host factor subunit beta [Planctomycetaceae bacterium]|nr:integration host factor subunit beta [Planctomycetaceae bacterium]
MATVNKRELVIQIAEQTGITQVLAREAVQKTFDAITATLAESGRLELRDFGVFEVRHRPAHKARNPLTGEAVKVPARMS